MSKLAGKTLAVFFTRGISFGIWEGAGILDRELLLYKKLSQEFRAIYFFTYGTQEEKKYEKILPPNITIFPKRWKMPSSIYIFLLPFLYRRVLRQVDIVKTNQMDGSLAAVLTKWLYRKKLVVRCGYEWLRTLKKKKRAKWELWVAFLVEWLAYKCANKIILTSSQNKKFVYDTFHVLYSKVVFLPNAVDTNLFQPLPVTKEDGRICFVGRIEPEKNLRNLIQAMGGLEVTLVVFGRGTLEVSLREFAKKSNVSVQWRGSIPNTRLPEELNKSDLFILPSLYENSPKALLEAMACGLPCIGTDVEGVREIIRHKENGYLCSTDTSSLRGAIQEVLQDRQLQEKISQGARKTIVDHFSLGKLFRKELDLYQSL